VMCCCCCCCWQCCLVLLVKQQPLCYRPPAVPVISPVPALGAAVANAAIRPDVLPAGGQAAGHTCMFVCCAVMSSAALHWVLSTMRQLEGSTRFPDGASKHV
jgi:hypothetical protein